MCGENCILTYLYLAGLGSPPRVRGKHHLMFLKHTIIGITPACAGKTLNLNVKIIAKKDHPRVCGENLACLCLLSREKGSPPRVRGKLLYKVIVVLFKRITPACAGKT